MKKFIKIVLIVAVSFIAFLFILGIMSDSTELNATTSQSDLIKAQESKQEESRQETPKLEEPKQVTPKTWDEMTYEERDSIMNLAIDKREFTNVSNIEYQMREAIKREARNPRTVTFTLSPSIYNGTANVVEADYAWIHTSYRGYAKNDFGVEKEFTGFVMYRYKPETKSLDVSHWDISFSE